MKSFDDIFRNHEQKKEAEEGTSLFLDIKQFRLPLSYDQQRTLLLALRLFDQMYPANISSVYKLAASILKDLDKLEELQEKDD
jgi:hypothetical protein